MEQSTEEPQQRKQPSRKGKKAWRKHVDLSDVQTGLEQARDEVIKGSVPMNSSRCTDNTDILTSLKRHHRRETLHRSFHIRYYRLGSHPKILQQNPQAAESRSNFGPALRRTSNRQSQASWNYKRDYRAQEQETQNQWRQP